MAWKDANNSNKQGDQNQKPDGPPDLDELLKKLFGFKKKSTASKDGYQSHGSQDPSSGEAFKNPFSLKWLGFIVIVFAVIWALSGIYVVQPAEQAAVLRFGKFVKVDQAGMHWYPRFIDTVTVLNVDQQKAMQLSASMLTSGENVVDVTFTVQYKIGNLQDYLFNVIRPDYSLKEILESAVRQAVGTSVLENILTTGRSELTGRVKDIVNNLVSRYQLGIEIVDVKMLSATPPSQVKEAFDDVIKAREDNQRFQNQAETYSNSVIPIAKGKGQRQLQQAKAYEQQQILLAQGAIAKFNALLPQYQAAQSVTATRLYFDTMSNVLSHSKLVLVDSGDKSGNMFYLPLDKFTRDVSNDSNGEDAQSQVQQAIKDVDAQEKQLIQAESNTFNNSDQATRRMMPSHSTQGALESNSNPFASSSQW